MKFKVVTLIPKHMKSHFSILIMVIGSLILSADLFAQYDDVYYDPSRFDSRSTRKNKVRDAKDYPENYETEKDEYDQQAAPYDGDLSEYDDQEYYYSSRIRRFHRNYYTRDFYDPFYTSPGFYDPYLDDPFLWSNSIVFSYGNWYYPWRARRWNTWGSWGTPYWGYYDWYYGNCPYTFAYRWPLYDPWIYNRAWGGWYDPWYYGPGWNTWGWYGGGFNGGGWYGGGWRPGGHNGHTVSNPKGTYYGSRRSGSTTTSRSGPIRLSNPQRTQDKVKQGGETTRTQPESEVPGQQRKTDRRLDRTKNPDEVRPNDLPPQGDTDPNSRKTRRLPGDRKTEDRQVQPDRIRKEPPGEGMNPEKEDKTRINRDPIRFDRKEPVREDKINRPNRYDDTYPDRRRNEPERNFRPERSQPQREIPERRDPPRLDSSPRSFDSGGRSSGGAGRSSSGSSNGTRRGPR